jgi:hypothetical protein
LGGAFNMRRMIRSVGSSKSGFGAFLMVIADPTKATVTIPDDYLIAIGKVCVQWSTLEGIMEMMIAKLAGFQNYDNRSKIMISHMAWPMRVDILSALAVELLEKYPRLKDYPKVLELLKKAQQGRNRIVHGMWGSDEAGNVLTLRATARGKLKLSMETR